MIKPPKEEDRLRHMLDAAITAVEFVKTRKRSDLDIVWQIVTADLPPLITELKKIIPPEK
jgi:hypothetical protein